MSEENDTLVPIEEKEVDFYGDTIVAVLVHQTDADEPEIYVPIRPITDYLGVSWSGQRERILRDPVLAEAYRGVRVTRTPEEGGTQEMSCLPIKYMHGWLFGINVNRVKEEHREKIILYKREIYDVIWQSFRTEALQALGQEPEVAEEQAALVYIAEMGRAITQLAEEQIQLTGRVSDVEDLAQGAHERLDTAAKVISNMMRRQDYLEARISPGKPITEEQAAEISGAVKALAQLLTEQDPNQNQYQSVFAELYRRFGVSSYKNLPVTKFQEVMQFLEEWRESTVGAGDEN